MCGTLNLRFSSRRATAAEPTAGQVEYVPAATVSTIVDAGNDCSTKVLFGSQTYSVSPVPSPAPSAAMFSDAMNSSSMCRSRPCVSTSTPAFTTAF